MKRTDTTVIPTTQPLSESQRLIYANKAQEFPVCLRK